MTLSTIDGMLGSCGMQWSPGKQAEAAAAGRPSAQQPQDSTYGADSDHRKAGVCRPGADIVSWPKDWVGVRIAAVSCGCS